MKHENPENFPLEADAAQMRLFLNTIFKRCAGIEGWVVLRAFEHEREGAAVVNKWVPFDKNLSLVAIETATQVANRTGTQRAVFSPPVAVFGEGMNDKGDKRFGGERNVIAAPAVAVELDANPQEALSTLKGVLGEPTLVIASGGSWEGQPKLHVYWRLGKPARTPEERATLKHVRLMAARLVGADESGVTLSHPMRWPGSWHTKGAPKLCEVIDVQPTRDITLEFAVKELQAAIDEAGIDLEKRHSDERANRNGFKTERAWGREALFAAADLIPNPPDMGWKPWSNVVMTFFDASHGSADGLDAVIYWSNKNPKGDEETTAAKWAHVERYPPDRLSAGTLVMMARDVNPDFSPDRLKPEAYFDAEARDAPDNKAAQRDEKLPNPFEQSEGQSDYFDMLSVADIMALPAPRYLIDRHLMQQSTCIVYGDPGAGKSFLTLDWALHLSSGATDWHGDEIEPIERPSVIYIAGEGVSGYQTRIKAWLARHPEADPALPGFRLIHQTMNFTSMEMVVKLVKSIKHICGGATLIVVDTVAKSIAGAEENSTKEMGLFVAACVNISKHFDCAVIGVHHTNKAGGMRGSSAVPGGVDTIFKLERKKGSNTGYLMCEKQKDGPGEWTETFQLETVCVGVDHKGKPVSSLVVSKDAAEVREASTQSTMLNALDTAWQMGAPWSDQPRSKDRYAPRIMAQRFDVSATHAQEILSGWLNAGIVIVDTLSAKSKTKGLRRVIFEADEEAQNPFD